MKKFIFICLIISCLTSCKQHPVDIEVYKTEQYTYDLWSIEVHNDYNCTKYNVIKNEDGTYTVTFIFDKMKADYRLPGQR